MSEECGGKLDTRSPIEKMQALDDKINNPMTPDFIEQLRWTTGVGLSDDEKMARHLIRNCGATNVRIHTCKKANRYTWT